MSARTNTFLSVGLMILMLLTIGVGGYFIKRANDQVDETKRLIIEGREIANVRGNQTLDSVGEVLKDTNELITQFNQTNEQGRSAAVDEIVEQVNQETRKLLEQYINKSKVKIK